MSKEKALMHEFTKGILVENPVLRLMLGTCPTLAVTTSAINGLGMGLSAMVVLVCSNIVISALRKVIPDRVRIPAYITIIATFVTVIQMFIKAFLPSINDALGIYVPLIVVNCIILGRAEMFASKNKVLPSILDGLGMGVGFTAALVLMGGIRELIGTGTLFNIAITKGHIEPMLIMIMAPGGFFVYGVLIALANKLAVKIGKKPVTSLGCASCPNASNCSHCETVENISDDDKPAEKIDNQPDSSEEQKAKEEL